MIGPWWEWTNGHGVTFTAVDGFDVGVLQRAAQPERRSHLRPVVRNPTLRALAMLPGETVEQARKRQRVRDTRPQSCDDCTSPACGTPQCPLYGARYID